MRRENTDSELKVTKHFPNSKTQISIQKYIFKNISILQKSKIYFLLLLLLLLLLRMLESVKGECGMKIPRAVKPNPIRIKTVYSHQRELFSTLFRSREAAYSAIN